MTAVCPRFIGLFAALLPFGCSPEPQPASSAVFLNYVGSTDSPDGTHGADPPFDMCALTGPGETIVLARTATAFEPVLYETCEPRDFRASHLKVDLEVLQQDGALPGRVEDTIWFPSTWRLNVTADTPAGTVVLASLRSARGRWFVTASVVVEPTDAQHVSRTTVYTDDERRITLPSTWAEVVTRASEVRDDYTTACPDLPKHRGMTDPEFDQYVYTAADEPCPADVGGTDAGTMDAEAD